MRSPILLLAILLTTAPAPAFAGEAFVSQIGNARHSASEFKSLVRDSVAAARIAAPVRFSAPTAPSSNTLPPNANVSSVTQIGTNNYAMVAQTGGNNLSTVVQQGSGNQAIVNQRR
jgi:hypothetical protein